MATVLLAWELGGGLGHLVSWLPIVRRLRGDGHRVYLAVRDLAQVETYFSNLGVSYLQAPSQTVLAKDRVYEVRSYADLLQNNGFANLGGLKATAEAWRHLYEFVRPELILFDHSPTALLAARGMDVRRATLGTGFCCPPDSYPLPDMQPWLKEPARLEEREERVLLNVNRVGTGWGAEPLERLSLLNNGVDKVFLKTVAEFDHYGERPGKTYYGVWSASGGDLPVWPQGPGRRIFVYLRMFRALGGLLEMLAERRSPTVIYMEQLNSKLRERYESPSMYFYRDRLDISSVVQQCDMAILNGGHGVTLSMLMSGVPVLQIPLSLEQKIAADATVRVGAGLSARSGSADDLEGKLCAMLVKDEYRQGAQQFAAKYGHLAGGSQTEAIVDQLEELLEAR